MDYSLERFLKAQDKCYNVALREIKAGEKDSHWMWYIFPQLRGLGMSSQAYKYGISGIDEAKAYLAHPILAARLVEISEAILAHKDKPVYSILGDIDSTKLKSSMTLFALVSEEGSVFHRVLQHFYDGRMDELTLRLLNGSEEE